MCDCEDNYLVTGGGVDRKARKPHKCCECHRVIVAGETYESFSGLWRDSGFDTFKTCQHCLAVRELLGKLFPDGCGFCFGKLAEDMLQTIWYESDYDGLTLGKIYKSVCRGWKYRRGSYKGKLKPIPTFDLTSFKKPESTWGYSTI